MSAWLRILIVAALCVITLVGLVVRESMARASGTEILLPVEAVDPRSLLSGNYVTIQPRDVFETGLCPPINDGEALWVALAPEGDHHRATGQASTREEALQIAPLVARGSMQCFPDTEGGGFVSVDLGFDRFHINQTEAQRIERVLREQEPGSPARVYAIVSVGKDGRARLKGLMVHGERLELNWL